MTVRVEHGDCMNVLPTLAENSIDSCVTDPPYHLTSIVKRFGGKNAAPAQFGTDGAYARASKGFMGKTWDGGDIAFRPELWREVYRVLKPGAHLIAFSGTRTYHRMACAIEDAGFEIRDQIGWLYGSGFPKSHDVSKGIDRAAGAEREVVGANPNYRDAARNAEHHERWNGAVMSPARTAPATAAAKQWEGWGTALKPAQEPICFARKPLSEKTVAANVLKHGTGALNIDGCRIDGEKPLRANTDGKEGMFGMGSRLAVGSSTEGRWPANVIHDGSEEVIAAFPESAGQNGSVSGVEPSSLVDNVYGARSRVPFGARGDNEGSAARFFWSPKADADDRVAHCLACGWRAIGNRAKNCPACGAKISGHPTVKPVDLFAYLCRLVTPAGGTVLDPFGGSGTCASACIREGFNCIIIERELEYYKDILARLAHIKGEDTPLFAGASL